MTGPGRFKRGPIIAVDGPSGVGKTTISRLLADRLHLRYINTGAMYRALALASVASGVDIEDEAALGEFCGTAVIEEGAGEAIIFNGKAYSPLEIRTQMAGELASIVSAKKPVREFLVRYQQELGKGGSVVMEGRDTGTVVFPDADIKFFLDASHEVRARRRHIEVAQKENSTAGEVSREIRDRDRRDSKRANSPLRMADDAIYVDTGETGIEEVVERLLGIIERKGIARR